MFDIGLPELVMILVIALLVFGPGKMADIGRDLGKAMRDFRRATTDVQKEFNDALRLDEEEKKPVPEWKPSPPSPTAVITPADDTASATPAERPLQEIAADVAGVAAGVLTTPVADAAEVAAGDQSASAAQAADTAGATAGDETVAVDDAAGAAAVVQPAPIPGTVAAGGAALRTGIEAEPVASDSPGEAPAQKAEP